MRIETIIMKKELKETLKNRSLLVSLLGIIIFIGIMVGSMSHKGSPAIMEGAVFHFSLFIGAFVAFSLSGRFVKEKQEGIIETLLCTPASLRSIWLGKVLGLTIPAWIVAILFTFLIMIFRTWLPSGAMIIHLLVVVPLFTASAIGLLGLLQFYLGMRQVQIFNLLIFSLLFGIVFAISRGSVRNVTISWTKVGLLLLVSSVILAAGTCLVSRLSKERIVTTIG